MNLEKLLTTYKSYAEKSGQKESTIKKRNMEG